MSSHNNMVHIWLNESQMELVKAKAIQEFRRINEVAKTALLQYCTTYKPLIDTKQVYADFKPDTSKLIGLMK